MLGNNKPTDLTVYTSVASRTVTGVGIQLISACALVKAGCRGAVVYICKNIRVDNDRDFNTLIHLNSHPNAQFSSANIVLTVIYGGIFSRLFEYLKCNT